MSNQSLKLECRVENAPAECLREAVLTGRQVFALLDACDEPLIPAKLVSLSREDSASLYKGAAEHDFCCVAPYLARVNKSLIDWIDENISGTPWGYFFTVPNNATLSGIRTHFRRFLEVKDPSGVKLYFRFYDPRVLLPFLRGCTPVERSVFFGPIEEFYLPDKDQQLTVIGIERIDSEAPKNAAVFQMTPKHMASFEQAQLEHFVERQHVRIQEQYSDLAILGETPEQHLRTIEKIVEEAFRYGVVGEQDVAFYLDLVFELSPNFVKESRFDWVLAILTRADLDGTRKIELINERLSLMQPKELDG
ncbi:MAG: DUF4123 domain-containing protein [Pirellula sp.]